MQMFKTTLIALIVLLTVSILSFKVNAAGTYQSGVDDSIDITIELYGSVRSTRVEFSGTDSLGNVQRWSETVYHKYAASAPEIRDLAIAVVLEKIATGDPQIHGFFKALRKPEELL